MVTRQLLVSLLAVVLLVWSVGDYNGWLSFGDWRPLEQLPIPFWYALWLLSLVVPVMALWFALAHIWRVWQPDHVEEHLLRRTAAGAVGGALLLGAVLLSQSADPSDRANAFMLILFAPFFLFWQVGVWKEDREARAAELREQYHRWFMQGYREGYVDRERGLLEGPKPNQSDHGT